MAAGILHRNTAMGTTEQRDFCALNSAAASYAFSAFVDGGHARAMATAKLRFAPAWYHVGNADMPALTIAYGMVAMATVWVFEAIVALVLYDRGAHISLADVGALVCHRGSTWGGLARWQFRTRRRRLNKRGYIAVLLRLLVTVVDVGIIVLAVPSTTPVTERDVGMSQINLRARGARLLPGAKYAGVVPNPCLWTRVKFQGFTPTATMLMCTNAMDDAEVEAGSTTSAGFVLMYNSKLQRLEFRTTPDNRPFFLTHNLFMPATATRAVPRTFNLPMPDDIEAQVARTVLTHTNCTRAGMNFTCPRRTRSLRTEILALVMENLYTSAVRNRCAMRKVMANRNYTVDEKYVELGSLNRPLLCIYPALILLGSLVVVYMGLKVAFRVSSGSIERKLFNLVAEATNAKVDRNPLVETDDVLQLSSDEEDGGRYLKTGRLQEHDCET